MSKRRGTWYSTLTGTTRIHMLRRRAWTRWSRPARSRIQQITARWRIPPKKTTKDIGQRFMPSGGPRQGEGKQQRDMQGRSGCREECRQEPTRNKWQDEPEKFPYKSRNCGEKGHRSAQCGKDKGEGRGKKGAYGVDVWDVEGAGAERAQNLGGLDICAVEEVWEVGTGQTGANIPNPGRPPIRIGRSRQVRPMGEVS